MNDFVAHIAEVEGIKTPTKTRTREDLTKAFDSFTEKRKAKKAKSTKPKTSAKTEKAARESKTAVKADPKPKATAVKSAEPIAMNFISPEGFVREAAFDPKTKLFHVTFAKSTWAFPATAEEWATFEKAVADPLTNVDTHYRKAFRGRGADMMPVRKIEVTA